MTHNRKTRGLKNTSLNRNGSFKKVHTRVPLISEIERSRNTQWERDVGSGYVPAAQTNGNRPIKVAKRVKNNAVKVLALIRRNALAHIAEDNARYSFQ